MKRIILIALLAALASTTLVAQVDIPLRNWTVPPYGQSAVSNDGIHTMTDISFNISFVAITVCRLLDTRPPVNNPLDGDGKYAADETRTYTIPPNCGIPTGTDAVSLNITVTDTDSNPFGHVKIWPASQAEPNVSTLNWSTGGVTESNAAVVALSGAGQLRVKTGNAGAHVIIDTNGYFTDTVNNFFDAEGTGSGIGIIFGRNFSTGIGSSAVRGQEVGASGAVYGVLGEVTASSTAGAAGVRGISSTAGAVGGFFSNSIPTTGVGARGDGYFRGVEGNATNNANSCGVCGTAAIGGSGSSGVSAFPNGGTFAALYTTGNFQALGSKSFVEPHALDPSKEINYISLEGPESGTYFRGKGKFERGMAVISVPEHFRLITDPEGLTVQITPIGTMATVAVVRVDLSQVVVQSSRNVEFFYTVNGIRKAFKNHNPIEENVVFRPDSAGGHDVLPDLTPAAREAMVKNGTLNPDGSWNKETAQKLGWKMPEPQP